MGLLVLFPAGDEEDVQSLTVDIVIVHGLNGNATKTWKSPDTTTFWPKDLLPKDLPKARVSTFEYNASAAFGKTTAGITDHAKTLLGSLLDYRGQAEEQKRPLIFIAHSLGGILVKQALLMAQRDPRYVAIGECTIGLIFFGTPHRGSTKAAYGKVLSQIATALMNSPASKLIATLQSNSNELQRLATDFKDLTPRYKIVSFYETKPIRPLKGMIVEKYSAVLDVPEEEQLPVDVNHADMCKFASRDDETYQMLLSRLWRIVEANKKQQQKVFDVEYYNKHYLVTQDVSAMFTGRNNVCDLLQKNCLPCPESKIQRRFVLYGLGGSGKTQIALQFAQNHRERFWGIFWIDCSTCQTITGSYLNIARICRITEDTDFVKLWLTNSPEPWLLILDNADDPSLDILSYLPIGSRGTVLITTKNPGIASLATVGDYQTAGMDCEEAVTLLLRVCELDGNSQEVEIEMARSLVKTLGFLALAIVQAGAFIRQKRCTIAQYSKMYAHHPRDLLSRKHSPSVTDYKYTVYTTWELSVDMILGMSDETSRHAIDLLHLFSLLHFASISEEIFERAAANVGDFESIVPCQLPWLVGGHSTEWNSSLYRDALERLSSFSLITWNKSNTVSMHPLVHAWARDRLNEAEHIQWSERAASILAMSIKSENWGEDCKYRRSIISHIVSSLSHVHNVFFTESDGIENRLNMIDSFAETFMENHLLEESATLRERILDTRRTVYAADSLEVLTSVESHIRSLFALGRFEEAVKSLQEVLIKKQAVLCKQDPSILRCKNTISRGLLALGWYEEAFNMQKGILQAQGPTFKLDPEILQSLEISARCYILRGRPQEALSIAQELLSLRQSRVGEEHLDVLSAKELVALSYAELGRYQDACELGESIFRVRLRMFGEESRTSLNSMNTLSLYYAELGHYQKACSIGEELLTITTRIFGERHPDTIAAMIRLVAFYHLLGLYQKSLNLAEKTQELAKTVLREDHPDSLLSLSQTAGCYASLGRLKEAEAQYQRVIEKQSKFLGPDHKSTLHSTLELASLCHDLGHFEESRALSDKVVAIRTKQIGGVHPDTLYAKHVLTNACIKLGHADSETMAHQLVNDMSTVRGQEHPHTLNSRQLLALCYHNSGRTNEAVNCQEAVVAAKGNVLGKQHPSTVIAIEHLETFRGRRKPRIGKNDRASSLSMPSKLHSSTIQNSSVAAKSVPSSSGSELRGLETKQQQDAYKSRHTSPESSGTSNQKPNKRWDVKALLRRH